MSINSCWSHDIHVYDLGENKWTLTKVQVTDQGELHSIEISR